MKTAKFICTEKDGKEIILMGFMENDDKLEKVYNGFYNYANLDTLYIKIAPITRENEKFVIEF